MSQKPPRVEWKPPPTKSNRPKRGDSWRGTKETREVFDVYEAGRTGYIVRYKFTRETPFHLEGIGRCNGQDWSRWCETAKEIDDAT